MNLTHGGDWAGFETEYGREPLDFSANVSPLGLPDGVRQAVIRELEHAHRYPDPLCRHLRRALGEKLSVDPEHILCGNGAADLIDRLVLALRPKKARILSPAFLEYAAALDRVECEITEFSLRPEQDFRVTEEILEDITPETDLVILCQPNNPTGVLTEPGLLGKIAARCDACGALLAVDECFVPFLEDEERYSMVSVLEQHRLLILRAFTKFYGMAGLRLGYCLCRDRDLLRAMAEAGQPWAVSSVAQSAGIAALQEMDYAKQVHDLIHAQRPVLQAGLEQLGCRVIPGKANYLLFSSPVPELDVRLREQGVLIRNCGNYHGLGEGWYRAAVRTEEENRQLLAAMERVMR